MGGEDEVVRGKGVGGSCGQQEDGERGVVGGLLLGREGLWEGRGLSQGCCGNGLGVIELEFQDVISPKGTP